MKFIIHNNRCFVDGNYAELRWIEDTLTIGTGKRNFRDGREIRHKFYNHQSKSFPTGLLSNILMHPGAPRLNIQLEDKRTKIQLPSEPALLRGYEKREYQEAALRTMLEKKRGTIRVATNGGKTVLVSRFLKTIEKLHLRTIVFIHNQEIFEQLYETISKAVKGVVGVVKGNRTDCSNSQVTIAMVLTFSNRLGEHPHVTKLYDECQVLIADECHHLQSPTYQGLFMESNAPIRLGFSGTVPDADTYPGWLVRACTGPILVDVTNKELIDAGVSAKPTVEMHACDSSKIFHKNFYTDCVESFVALHAPKLPNGQLFRHDGGFVSLWWKVQFFGFYQRRSIEHGMIHNDSRNRKIVRLVCDDPKHQHLLVTERVDHGSNLLALFRELKEDAEFVSGDTPAAERDDAITRFRQGKLRILISSTILDEGVDIDRIETLVLAGVMKSKRALKQRIGRGLRKKKSGPNILRVVDFMDAGNRYMEKYSKDREEIWLSEGFDVKHVGG